MVPPILFILLLNLMAGEAFYKIYLSRTGVYKITGEELQSAGANLDEIQPQTIQLLSDGQQVLPYSTSDPLPQLSEVAIIVEDGADGQFDPEDYLLFYGQAVNRYHWSNWQQTPVYRANPYDSLSCYWLRWNVENGQRIAVKNGNPVTPGVGLISRYIYPLHLEKDRFNPYKSGLTWTWNLFGTVNSFSHQFDLPEAVGSMATVNGLIYRYRFWTYFFPTGEVQISLNGVTAGPYPTDNSYHFSETLPVASGTNVLELNYFPASLQDTVGQVGLDWVEIRYPRYTAYQGESKQIFLSGLNGIHHVKYQETTGTDSIIVLDVTDPRAAQQIVSTNDTLFEDTLTGSHTSYFLYRDNTENSVLEIEPAERNIFSDKIGADYLIVTHRQMLPELSPLQTRRQVYNRFQVEVVTMQDIYDEFGFGRKDPTALRNFIRFADANWMPRPKFVLLAGNGYYDYRNLTGNYPVNWVPTFEIDDDNDIDSRATDDYFAALHFTPSANQIQRTGDKLFSGLLRSPFEQISSEFQKQFPDSFATIEPELAIGRFPANNPAELAIMIDKTLRSELNYPRGLWRISSMFVADDNYPSPAYFTLIAEELQRLNFFSPSRSFKLYETEYPLINQEKPAATRQLINWINQANRILYFTGHSNERQWTHENLLNYERDMSSIKNFGKYSFFIAASQGYKFDDMHNGIVQKLLRKSDSGINGSFTGNKPVYIGSSLNLIRLFFEHLSGSGQGYVGKAAYLAKDGSINNQKFTLLADPALQIKFPPPKVHITNIQPDTLKARSLMQIEGMVDAGTSADSLIVEVREPGKIHSLTGNYDYESTGRAFYRGMVPVNSVGQFTVQFVVPDDVPHDSVVSRGKFYAYTWNQLGEGLGFRDSLKVGGVDSGIVDTTPPQISLSVFNRDTVSWRAILEAELFDENGINLSSLGNHQPMVFFDHQYQDTLFVSEFFRYNSGSYQAGRLLYPLPYLTEGPHSVTLVVHDNFNNMASDSIQFTVTGIHPPPPVTPESVILFQNYPNPFNPQTTIPFRLNGRKSFRVNLEIYNILGQRVRSLFNGRLPAGEHSVTWNGRNNHGQLLASGIYMYRLWVSGHAADGAANQRGGVYVKTKKLMLLK